MKTILSITALLLLTVVILLAFPGRMMGQNKDPEPAKTEDKSDVGQDRNDLLHQGGDQAQPGEKKPALRFIDLDGDGINDNMPDHDRDGIPNSLDPDFKRGKGIGMKKDMRPAEQRRQLRQAMSDRLGDAAGDRPAHRLRAAQRIRR